MRKSFPPSHAKESRTFQKVAKHNNLDKGIEGQPTTNYSEIMAQIGKSGRFLHGIPSGPMEKIVVIRDQNSLKNTSVSD